MKTTCFGIPGPEHRRPRLFSLGALLLAMVVVANSRPARAADELPPSERSAALSLAPTAPPPANPAFSVAPAPARPSVFRRWWFWTAVGAAVAATVVIVVVSSRGQAPPSTDLGNQEFQP